MLRIGYLSGMVLAFTRQYSLQGSTGPWILVLSEELLVVGFFLGARWRGEDQDFARAGGAVTDHVVELGFGHLEEFGSHAARSAYYRYVCTLDVVQRGVLYFSWQAWRTGKSWKFGQDVGILGACRTD